jgi:hypothetical protein
LAKNNTITVLVAEPLKATVRTTPATVRTMADWVSRDRPASTRVRRRSAVIAEGMPCG